MKALAAASVLMALAGCGILPGRLSQQVPQTPDQAACAAKAEDDPQVKLLIIKGLGNPTFKDENQETLRLARADAARSCLVSRGVVRPGGVERQKPL